MPVSVRTTKPFIPTSYRYKARRQDETDTAHDGINRYIPTRLLKKLLKVAVIFLLALLLGHVCSSVLKGFAETNTEEVSSKIVRPLKYAMRKRDEKLESLNRKRLTKMKNQCSGGDISEPKFLAAHQKKGLYNRVFVDHKHKFAYCSVPKAACTKWKQILLKSGEVAMYEDENIEDIFPHLDYQFKRLSDLDTIKALRVLDTYYTFTFVRDPLVRIVSAWRDKFQHHPKENRSDYINFHHQYGRNIMRRFREKFTPHELERGFPISFQEYINYITSFSNVEEMNEHWIPVTTICRPCHINYNFIGKFENQKEESEYLIDKLNLQNYVPDHFFKEANNSSRDEAQVLLRAISVDKKQILAKFYKDDAAIFGYDLNEFLGID